MKRVCIFVDGENLRHSIVKLFPAFRQHEYLPMTDWAGFFDWVAEEVVDKDGQRIRTYWYVVEQVDYSPFNLNSARRDPVKLESILSRDENHKRAIATKSGADKETYLQQAVDGLEDVRRAMQDRFDGWRTIQDSIESKNMAVEFRRAGAIRYNLFERTLGSEKAVDVKLATDLLKLKDIYDVAIIVSGDQDYVPAVNAVKDLGKHVISVAFQTEDGKLLPGGAKRLAQATDWNLEISHADLKRHLGL